MFDRGADTQVQHGHGEDGSWEAPTTPAGGGEGSWEPAAAKEEDEYAPPQEDGTPWY